MVVSHETAALLLLMASSSVPLVGYVVPVNLNIIFQASLIVYIGSYRSLKSEEPIQAMTQDEAFRFPFVGSAVLFSLFMLFKFLPKEMVNRVLTVYFIILGVGALSSIMLPYVRKIIRSDRLLIDTRMHIPYSGVVEFRLSWSEFASLFLCTLFCSSYAIERHWLSNNVLGIAFSLNGIELISISSYKIGCILLLGLFVYDVFWVFGTNVMVSVARGLDAPIKLLFPRMADMSSSESQFSMLGLGDIVIPGIFVALMLRFDNHRSNGLSTKYFYLCLSGYICGLSLTVFVMNYFNAAQPALLYIVPCIISFVSAPAIWAGDFRELVHYSEENESAFIEESACVEEHSKDE